MKTKLEINKQRLRNQQKRKIKRAAKKKAAYTSPSKGLLVVQQIFKTIVHLFPHLFDEMRKIEDYRKKSNYELVELIMAGVAMFIFKEGSRNAFNNDRQEGKFRKNYERVFKLRLPHMDTVDKVMRKLAENELEELKVKIVRILLEKKVLHKFRFRQKWTVAVDATGVVNFGDERHCEHCLHRTSKKSGKTTYFHNVLEAKLVFTNGFSISLGTEWVENSTEYDKQDCELKAFKRLAVKLKKWFARLPICILADSLYPSQQFFEICKENKWSYMVTLKEGKLPSLWAEALSLLKISKDNNRTENLKNSNESIHRDYVWVNGIDYHGHVVNWLKCVEQVEKIKSGEVTSCQFVHITDLPITYDNVAKTSQTARLRCNIENQGFNTQKNHGYKLQHKYSRTNQNASKNYYQCLQIGHLINQLVELSNDFKELFTNSKITVCHIWKNVIGFMTFCDVDSEQLSVIGETQKQIRFQ
jgi:hypothetical protein